MESPPSRLWDLPRELRDQIYLEYLTSTPDRTYVFDFESKRLRTPDNRSIDLSLMYTCKRIAKEMRGMALRTHTIRFNTIYSDELRTAAGRFNCAIMRRWSQLSLLFYKLGNELHLGTEILRGVVQSYPEIDPLLQAFAKGSWRDTFFIASSDQHWAESPYIARQAISETLRILLDVAASCPSLRDHLDSRINTFWGAITNKDLILKDLEPWTIPSQSDLDVFFELQDCVPYNEEVMPAGEAIKYRPRWDHEPAKYRFSATAGAITFLRSMPGILSDIRNILICEDRSSVGFSECHSIGLIPFCKENPALRIVQRVDLWSNVLQDTRPRDYLWLRMSHRDFEDLIPHTWLSWPVARWMTEASVLPRLGMPRKQFTMILDGDPTPEKTSEIFYEIICRDAAWQEAIQRCYTREHPNGPPCSTMLGDSGYLYPTFPELLRNLSIDRDSGLIRCNFNPGPAWSVDELLQLHPDWNWRTWWDHRLSFDKEYYTVPPLPSWGALVMRDMLQWYHDWRVEYPWTDPDEGSDADDDEEDDEGDDGD